MLGLYGFPMSEEGNAIFLVAPSSLIQDVSVAMDIDRLIHAQGIQVRTGLDSCNMAPAL